METVQPQRIYKTSLAQRQAAKRWRDKWPERDRDRHRRYFEQIAADPDQSRIEKQRARKREYYAHNKEICRAAHNRHRNTPNGKVADQMRGLLRAAAKKGKKSKIEHYLGCSLEMFRLHIAAQFSEGMDWENHGKVWELDHIKPCAAFDLTTEEGKHACFHYTNTQPLWKRANQIKHAKVA